MEVPLCSGEIRRRGFCIILSVLPHYYGPTGYDYGVCSRACQQKKYYKKLCAVGKRGDKVAFARLCRFGGQLLPDDVLYYGSGLDAVLFYLMLTGRFIGADAAAVGQIFGDMLAKPGVMAGLMLLVVAVGFGICSVGLQSGVERMTKGMMVALLGIMLLLAFHSVTMEGGAEGISFYLKPDFERMMEVGIGETMVGAMNQAFFTLSLGIGSMAIFGSYIGKEHALLKESVNIAVLDTCVAVVAGLIIFPACFSFGINPDSGPSLIFVTLPNVFNSMAGGRVWGTLFFVFMSFAAFSTVLAVFENIISCCMDMWGISRKKACLINFILLGLLSLPCVLGFNLWSGFMPFGEGSNVLDLEDFIVSNLMLPIGSFIYLLFCVSKIGWGFDNYLKEANTGKGMKVPRFLKPYLQFILPAMILFIFIKGIIDKF